MSVAVAVPASLSHSATSWVPPGRKAGQAAPPGADFRSAEAIRGLQEVGLEGERRGCSRRLHPELLTARSASVSQLEDSG